ncbi:hypothetical protein G6F37_000873 [Rhizopus arrhizus]|nr:hypothetical protein G6F38_002053 [Rhizopus arrhizus]KAG1163804.1 hypothetical protein G6F37_000873 [Rhizopus arrhizus]
MFRKQLIHHQKRGYTSLYLPPSSPELNPIEHFWAILKRKVKRSKFTDAETLTFRVTEASESVPVEHLHNFVQHSVDQFESCLNRYPM